MASFRTGYEGLSQAIQGAFDTYYRRKEGQEERGSREEMLKKQIASAENEGDKDRANRLKIEMEGIKAGKYEHDPSMTALKNSMMTQDRERRLGVLQDQIKYKVDLAMEKVITEMSDNEGWTYKKMSEWAEVPATKLEKWEQANLSKDEDLAYDYIRKRITEQAIREAITAPENSEFKKGDLYPYFEKNLYVTMESEWNQEKYDVPDERPSLYDDLIPRRKQSGSDILRDFPENMKKIGEFFKDQASRDSFIQYVKNTFGEEGFGRDFGFLKDMWENQLERERRIQGNAGTLLAPDKTAYPGMGSIPLIGQ